MNSFIASAASTPPVIAISRNGVLLAISLSVTMVCLVFVASWTIEAPYKTRPDGMYAASVPTFLHMLKNLTAMRCGVDIGKRDFIGMT